MDKSLENILKKLMHLKRNAFFLLKEEIDNIIKNNIKDKNFIEHLLDNLYDCIYDEYSLNYYYQFCDYYEKIDLEASLYYRNLK